MKWIMLGAGFGILLSQKELEISPGVAVVVLLLFVVAAVVDGGQRSSDDI